MKIDETARQELHNRLESANDGYWLQLVSQIQYFGDDVCFFFLVADEAGFRRSCECFTSVAKSYFDLFMETKFSASFIEQRNGMEITWEALEDDQLRTGRIFHPLGSYPDIRPPLDPSVFAVGEVDKP